MSAIDEWIADSMPNEVAKARLVSCPKNSLHNSPVIPGKPAIPGATRNPGNSKGKLDSRFRENDF
jgi:hypothetical protein